MPINSRPLGPGTLTLGAGALEVSSQLTSCTLTPSESVETAERVKVLSGESKGGNESASYAFVLEGTFLQDDPGAASVVDWSWDTMGTPQPFVFVPSTAGGREVTGTLTPVPLAIGGDEVDGADMSSDFTWRVTGTPELGTVGV
jgi:hypothetical protein